MNLPWRRTYVRTAMISRVFDGWGNSKLISLPEQYAGYDYLLFDINSASEANILRNRAI